MQVYNKTNSIKNMLLFVLVLFIAYLPVSTFLFFIKNDAFNGYYPPRFFMSESLSAGYLPLWNPYVNYGFPQYGDMSGSYWSPLVWLISLSGYNAYIFTLEILGYLLIGALGMYKLIRHFTASRTIRILGGLVILCCGFNSSHLQHVNWISGIAFLVWVINSYLNLLKTPGIKNSLFLALTSYLFISSSHPTLIISAIYFLSCLLFFTWFSNSATKGWHSRPLKHAGWLGLAIFALLLLSAGLITGYLDILPHFVRAKAIDLATSLEHNVPVRTWASFLMPLSVIKDPGLVETELTMRNMYIGLPAFILVLHSLFVSKTRWQLFFLITAVCFMLLSTGGIFKKVAYYLLPLMSYVRLNGIFLGITTICLVCAAAIEAGKIRKINRLSLILFILTGLFASVAIIGLVAAFITKESILFNMGQSGLKQLIDSLTYYDTLWIQGSVQLIICAMLLNSRGSKTRIKWIVIADLVMATLLNLPFTGVGQNSVADVQRVLNKSPRGIPVPANKPISANDTLSSLEHGLTGHWSMYNKQPGVSHWVPYPVTLDKAWRYLESLHAGDPGYLHYPFIFVADGNAQPPIQIIYYSPNEIRLAAGITRIPVIFQQNYFPHWYYYIDKRKKPVEVFEETFIAVPESDPNQSIVIKFEPRKVKIAMLISLFSLIALIGILWMRRKRLN